jgi:hypothetical protein
MTLQTDPTKPRVCSCGATETTTADELTCQAYHCQVKQQAIRHEETTSKERGFRR